MATANGARARSNRILEALPAADRALVDDAVDNIDFEPGELVCARGRRIRHVFFPRSGVISLFAAADGGPDVGVAVLGSGGMFGLAVAAGRPRSSLRAVSQGQGNADRIESASFVELLARSPALRDAMLRYGHALAAQLAQNTACMSAHAAPRRLARWMLDVTPGDGQGGRFSSTQAETALALGVQRPAVSRAAGSLQAQGLIRYLRGEVSILDRGGLARVACRCSLARRSPSRM